MNQFAKWELEHLLYVLGSKPMDDCSLYMKIKAMVDNYCEHTWDNQCCGCAPENIYCSTCNIILTTNLVETGS